MDVLLSDGLSENVFPVKNKLSVKQKEQIRLSQVSKNKNYVYIEMINGKNINIIEGLELYTRVFNIEEQKNIVECIYNFQCASRKGMLKDNYDFNY